MELPSWLNRFFRARGTKAKTLYLIWGLPGHGKTSLAKRLARYQVAADDMPGLYLDGEYQLTRQSESHQWCRSKVEQWMALGKSPIAVHNTLLKSRGRDPYIQMALKCGYSVQVIEAQGILLPDGNFAQSEHQVPSAVIEKMKAGREDFICP